MLAATRTVAVVGGGVSGLSCARELGNHGFSVRVFDKARRPGGRTSTRRTSGGLVFDHGAQYMTARTPDFRRAIEAWQREGVVGRWAGPFASVGGDRRPRTQSERYVGIPTMSALSRHLASGLDTVSQTRIVAVQRRNDARNDARWCVVDESGTAHGGFDSVVVAVPAGQAVPLLEAAPALAERAASVVMAPCWAVMLVFESPLPVAFGGVSIQGAAVAWAARQASKPGRPDAEAWVLHATPAWTEQHWDHELATVAAELLKNFSVAVGFDAPPPVTVDGHRWRYARAPDGASSSAVGWDPALGLGVCGDWCRGSRIEDAWLSGRALAQAMVDCPSQA
ncbi:MAG: FAD-dependent oxidoreductase [Myxococcota bacterium]